MVYVEHGNKLIQEQQQQRLISHCRLSNVVVNTSVQRAIAVSRSLQR